MKKPAILSIRGTQHYGDQEPEVIQLTTQGTLEYAHGGWEIAYAESALTGLEGVFTTFRVEPEQVILTRTGRLNSRMVFRKGVPHDSLYEMEFGALQLTVQATWIFCDILPEGGTVDLSYTIDIEHTTAGTIDYHLDIRTLA